MPGSFQNYSNARASFCRTMGFFVMHSDDYGEQVARHKKDDAKCHVSLRLNVKPGKKVPSGSTVASDLAWWPSRCEWKQFGVDLRG